MSQEAYEALRRDLVGGYDSAANLYRRLQDVKSKEEQLEAERQQAQEAGERVPDLYNDETHKILKAERESILADLMARHKHPRLSREEAAAFRAQLTPKEKAQLRQDLLQQIQSAPPEIKTATKASMDEAIQAVREKLGSTPETEAAFAKMKKIKDEI